MPTAAADRPRDVGLIVVPRGSAHRDGRAILTGRCWRELAASVPGFTPVAEQRIVLAGARDLDSLEERALGVARIVQIPARDVDVGAGAAVDGLSAAVAAPRETSLPDALTLSAHDPAQDANGRIARAALRVVRVLLDPA